MPGFGPNPDKEHKHPKNLHLKGDFRHIHENKGRRRAEGPKVEAVGIFPDPIQGPFPEAGQNAKNGG